MSSLAFGYNGGLPDGVKAAWGARFIFPDDLVYNRQDLIGADTEDGKKLLDWLNGGALGAARAKARTMHVSSAETVEVVLHEDETGIVLGNPQGSYGYLYVVAFLKEGQ